VPETADASLLVQPLRCLTDIEAIERIPLERRLGIVDISQRIALGLAAHDPADTAIFYVPDGDVDRPPVTISFSELRGNIEKTASLLCAGGVGRDDVVAVLLPAVPTIYWSILGAMAAGIAFPVRFTPRSRRRSGHTETAAQCQCRHPARLLDHLVGAGEQGRRNVNADRQTPRAKSLTSFTAKR
jgi:acyl-CoA synthetase (AMP-forming)/AMP-acid ligase II